MNLKQCIDFVGGTSKPSWRQALFVMPVALAGIAISSVYLVTNFIIFYLVCVGLADNESNDSLNVVNDLSYLAMQLYFIVQFSLTFIPTVLFLFASAGCLSHGARTRLAMISYYYRTLLFLVSLVILIPSIIVIPIAGYVAAARNSVDQFWTAFAATLVLFFFVLLLLFMKWELSLTRSLFQILRVNGTGWELQTDEEIAALAKGGESQNVGQYMKGIPQGQDPNVPHV